MVVLGFGATHPDAAVNLDTLVRRRLENNLRLKRELEAGYDASGGAAIPFDHERRVRLYAMIAQGLAWYHCKVLLGPGFSAIASLFNDAGAPFFAQMLSGWRTPTRVSDNLGNGTFVYEGAQAIDVTEATIWRFHILRQYKVRRRSCRPRTCIARRSVDRTGFLDSAATSIDDSASCDTARKQNAPDSIRVRGVS